MVHVYLCLSTCARVYIVTSHSASQEGSRPAARGGNDCIVHAHVETTVPSICVFIVTSTYEACCV